MTLVSFSIITVGVTTYRPRLQVSDAVLASDLSKASMEGERNRRLDLENQVKDLTDDVETLRQALKNHKQSVVLKSQLMGEFHLLVVQTSIKPRRVMC